MISTAFSEKMFMSELIVEHAHQKNHHVFDATAGKVNSSFGYIVNGSCEIHSMGKTLELSQGTLFYLPDGVRYRSVWTGAPDIEQYCIHIVPRKYSVEHSAFYPLQVIEKMSTPEVCARFKEIYSLFSLGDNASRLRAIGLFYAFYSDVLPLLETSSPLSYSPVVAKAVAYIEENYARNFSTSVLADICHISESRLYHLFNQELGISPTLYRNEVRIEKAARELSRRTAPIETIAFETGFNSLSYFYSVFKSHTGLNPSEYRNIHGKKAGVE